MSYNVRYTNMLVKTCMRVAHDLFFFYDDSLEYEQKLFEELNELKFAQEKGDMENVKEEIGDVFFSVVNLSRFLGFSAEDMLRETNRKFIYRFVFNFFEHKTNICMLQLLPTSLPSHLHHFSPTEPLHFHNWLISCCYCIFWICSKRLEFCRNV